MSVMRKLAILWLSAALLPAFPDGAAFAVEPRLAQRSAAPAPAAPKAEPAANEAVARLAGAYRLASADGERKCELALKSDKVAGGYALTFDKAACASIPLTAQAVAWTPDPAGAMLFLNAKAMVVAEFTAGAGGSFEALIEGDGVYFLSPPTAEETIEVSHEELVGEWDIARVAGAPVCRWTLTDRPTPKGGFQVLVAPGCEAALAAFQPAAWDIEGGNVVVRSGSGAAPLRFARQEDGGWSRTPERGRPLLLVRP